MIDVSDHHWQRPTGRKREAVAGEITSDLYRPIPRIEARRALPAVQPLARTDPRTGDVLTCL
jgi:hypothetical protein